ncbi:MAG TPA: hypothetical protein VF414_14020 [Thermoanaerobaculia bacterium]
MGIGLALVFTLVALICSIVNEWISAMVEKRGNLLWEGIENLVGRELRGDICSHQLMQGLVRKQTWFDAILKRLLPGIDRAKPSYVPTEMFVATLLDIVGARAAAGGNPRAAGQLPTTFAGLQTAIQNANGVPDNVKQALLALVNNAGSAAADELAKAKKNIGDWFDAGMGRVTGWYKRWSQLILILVGLGVAFFLGVDCIAIAKRLWTDPVVRDRVVAAAGEFVEENKENRRLSRGEAPSNAGDAGETGAAPQAGSVPLNSDMDSNFGADPLLASDLDTDLTTDTLLTSDAPEILPTEDDGTSAAEEQTVAETETAEELAKEKLKDIQIFQSQLEALSLPLFPMTGLREEYRSSHTGVEASLLRMFGWWLSHHLFGFVLTSFAASLGAPFWFDLLNRFVNLRTTGKKPVEVPAKS